MVIEIHFNAEELQKNIEFFVFDKINDKNSNIICCHTKPCNPKVFRLSSVINNRLFRGINDCMS